MAATHAGEPVMLAGVELGGTKCICVLGTGPDDVRETVEIPTTSPDETIAALAGQLAKWDYEAIGIASFGPLDLDRNSASYGSIVNTTKAHWSGTSLLPLTKSKPFAIDTDVNGAALAEGRWGAAQGYGSWAYITVGTGIGVGSICDGKPLDGLGHSEAGHQRVARLRGDVFAGVCSFHGDCVEGLASGPAIEARAGMKGRDIPPHDDAWNHAAHTVAMLCHNLALTTVPQRILIGGGVPVGQPQLLPMVKQHLSDSLAGYAITGAIEMDDYIQLPGLGAQAGPMGALSLAWNAYRSAN